MFTFIILLKLFITSSLLVIVFWGMQIRFGNSDDLDQESHFVKIFRRQRRELLRPPTLKTEQTLSNVNPVIAQARTVVTMDFKETRQMQVAYRQLMQALISARLEDSLSGREDLSAKQRNTDLKHFGIPLIAKVHSGKESLSRKPAKREDEFRGENVPPTILEAFGKYPSSTNRPN